MPNHNAAPVAAPVAAADAATPATVTVAGRAYAVLETLPIGPHLVAAGWTGAYLLRATSGRARYLFHALVGRRTLSLLDAPALVQRHARVADFAALAPSPVTLGARPVA